MVPFIEMKNRGGSNDFGVDKDFKFTCGHVKFEVEQENTHVPKAVMLFSLKFKKEFLLDWESSAYNGKWDFPEGYYITHEEDRTLSKINI